MLHKKENTHSQDQKRFCTYAYRVIWNEICTVLIGTTKAKSECSVDPNQADALFYEIQADSYKGISNTELRIMLEQLLKDAGRTATGSTAKGCAPSVYGGRIHFSEIAKMMGGASCHHVTAWISKARRHIKSDPELMRMMQYST